MPTCDCCGGDLLVLGVLGNTEHFSCRGCGAEFSRPFQPEDEPTRDLELEVIPIERKAFIPEFLDPAQIERLVDSVWIDRS